MVWESVCCRGNMFLDLCGNFIGREREREREEKTVKALRELDCWSMEEDWEEVGGSHTESNLLPTQRQEILAHHRTKPINT